MKMNKFLTIALAGVLSLGCAVGLASCDNGGDKKEVVKLNSQLDALTQLNVGTVNVAIIDSVMANYYTNVGDFSGKVQIVNNLVFAEEQYGIAGRKGDEAFVSKINDALIAIRETDFAEVATTYGLTSEIAISEDTTNPLADATDNSWNEIKSTGKIVIGYTVYAPIAYEENNKLVGFDIELAKKTVAYINETEETSIDVEFQVIDWNSKEALLDNGTIDLIWNGLTITKARKDNMCISVPYLNNKQVAVIRKEDAEKYTTKESIATTIIGVEAGSAGEDVANALIG